MTHAITLQHWKDSKAFFDSFSRLGYHETYVVHIRVCRLRRDLGWDVERFDRLVHDLWNDGIILPLSGDRYTLTDEDVEQGFFDGNDRYDVLHWYPCRS